MALTYSHSIIKLSTTLLCLCDITKRKLSNWEFIVRKNTATPTSHTSGSLRGTVQTPQRVGLDLQLSPVPCSRVVVGGLKNRRISLWRSPVPAHYRREWSSQAPADELGEKTGNINKNRTTQTSSLHEHDECLCSLHLQCNQSTSSLPSRGLRVPAPTSLLSLQLTISWQNIEGKFHGWWQRCEKCHSVGYK